MPTCDVARAVVASVEAVVAVSADDGHANRIAAVVVAVDGRAAARTGLDTGSSLAHIAGYADAVPDSNTDFPTLKREEIELIRHYLAW